MYCVKYSSENYVIYQADVIPSRGSGDAANHIIQLQLGNSVTVPAGVNSALVSYSVIPQTLFGWQQHCPLSPSTVAEGFLCGIFWWNTGCIKNVTSGYRKRRRYMECFFFLLRALYLHSTLTGLVASQIQPQQHGQRSRRVNQIQYAGFSTKQTEFDQFK